MDFRLNRNFYTSKGRISVFFEARNLYNRKNTRDYEYSNLIIHSESSYSITRIPREWRNTFGDDALPVGWITPPGSDLVTMGRHHYEMRELQRRTADKERGVDLIFPATEHIPFSAQPEVRVQ